MGRPPLMRFTEAGVIVYAERSTPNVGDAAGQGGMEHMASFNYAYKLSPVRDWLFGQSL